MNETTPQPNDNATPNYSGGGGHTGPSYDNARSLLGILNGYLIAHEASPAERDPKEFPYVYGHLVMTVGYLTGTPSGGYDRQHIDAVLSNPQQVGSLLERMLNNTIQRDDEDTPPPPGSTRQRLQPRRLPRRPRGLRGPHERAVRGGQGQRGHARLRIGLVLLQRPRPA